jgi:putative hydroxymethylpyrimidine transporter CytX
LATSTSSPSPETKRRLLDVPAWGIDPVPAHLRQLGGFDTGALWGNLGISLLLPIVAAFLVPGLSFRQAALAIVIGVVIGNLMLGYAGRIGTDTGAPAMVLYRPALGRHGSFAPTVLNVLQNIGWGAFELIIISTAASAITARAFGVSAQPAWAILFGLIVTLMAVGGPLVVVRQWISRYAIWLVGASAIYLTVYVLVSEPLATFTGAGGDGSMPFWQGVDLVVAMPISWIPLAADYTRFARTRRAGFAGTAIGYGIAHAWFYFLGLLLVLSNIASNPADPTGFVVDAMLAIPFGVLALAILAVDESDEAFANIYSASVSVQNVFPRVGQRALSIAIGALCTVIAVVVPLVQYENFLLLIGAVFVPLFGVLAAHYAVVRRGSYSEADLYAAGPSVRVWGCIAWVAGFAVYNWLNPGTVSWWVSAMRWVFDTVLGAPFPATASVPWLSASIASFVLAFALQSAEALFRNRGARSSARASAP